MKNEKKYMLEKRKESYYNIIDCLQDELSVSIMINDRDYADNLHKSIWDLRDKICKLTKELQELE